MEGVDTCLLNDTELQLCRVAQRIPPSEVLAQFKSISKSGVKYEYIRMRLLRSLKRSLRQYLRHNSFGLSGVARYSTSHSTQLVEEIKLLCQTHRIDIEEFTEKTNGPKIDHLRSNIRSEFHTYNGKYIAHIFEKEVVRRIYGLFVDVVFEEKDLDRLRANWKMDCCGGAHTALCSTKWQCLKSLLQQELYSRELVFPAVD